MTWQSLVERAQSPAASEARSGLLRGVLPMLALLVATLASEWVAHWVFGIGIIGAVFAANRMGSR